MTVSLDSQSERSIGDQHGRLVAEIEASLFRLNLMVIMCFICVMSMLSCVVVIHVVGKCVIGPVLH